MSDLKNTLMTLQDIAEQLQDLKRQADAAIRELPRHYRSHAEAYQITNFGTSSNRYDNTFFKLIDALEEEINNPSEDN